MSTVDSAIIAAEQDLVALRGDSYARKFNFFQGQVTFDLSIYTALKMQIKFRDTDVTPVIEGNLATELIVNSNNLEIRFTAAQMSISPTSYRYDVEGTTATSEVQTILKGRFRVESDTTRP